MNNTFGTFELAMLWPDGRQERLPLALIREAFTSLPDEQSQLRAQLAALTRRRATGTDELTESELATMEAALLNASHVETSDFGLLSQISFHSDGRLVNPNELPEDWPGVQAPFVLAVAMCRFRLLRQALGVQVRSIDIDEDALPTRSGEAGI